MLSLTTEEAKSNYVECYFHRHSFLLSKKDQFIYDKCPLSLGSRILTELISEVSENDIINTVFTSKCALFSA